MRKVIYINRKEKWWFHAIRGMNLFAFRFWWLILLLFLLGLFLSYFLCFNKEVAQCEQYIKVLASSDNAIKNILNCCDCEANKSYEKAVDCPDRELVFQVCNSNKAKDDNFHVFLNNEFIGILDLSANDDVGSIFVASLDDNLVIQEADFSCPINKMKIYRFNPTIILYGENTIELRNIKNNNNDNKGTIEIRNYQRVGADLLNPCVVNNLSFEMESGLNYKVNFNYTRCCE